MINVFKVREVRKNDESWKALVWRRWGDKEKLKKNAFCEIFCLTEMKFALKSAVVPESRDALKENGMGH